MLSQIYYIVYLIQQTFDLYLLYHRTIVKMYPCKVSIRMRMLDLLLIFGLQLSAIAGFADFIQSPVDVNVRPESSGGIAVFFCQHNTAEIITWLVNDTTLSNIAASNITECTSSIPNGPPLHTLKIATEREYNMTEVVCLALFLDGSRAERTTPVDLILQDNLEPFPNGFLETPASLNVSIGEEATFSCQHCTASRINWLLNGSLIHDGNMPNGVTINYNNTVRLYCGTFTLTISMLIVENYNRTSIQCEAEVDGSLNTTSPVLLLVQGLLAPVTNLRRNFESQNTLAYSWSQPHSLDITSLPNPGIIYCVHIYSFPCSSYGQKTSLDSNSVYSACNVTEPNIVIDQQLDRDLLYGIEVLPRINLDVAQNGTRNFYEDEFVYFDDTNITYKFDISSENEDMIEIQIVLNLESINSKSIQPRNISLKFMTINPLAPRMKSAEFACLTSLDHTLSDNNTASNLNILNCPSIKIKMLYVGTLVVSSTECQISSPFEYSTHLIQSVTLALTHRSSEISVSCTFVTTSNKPRPYGFLAIAYSTSENVPMLHYGIVRRSTENALNAKVIIPRLYDYEYRVSVFELNEDGLPSNTSVAVAQTISNVTNREGTGMRIMNETEGHNSTLIVEASQNPTDNCIDVKCIFVDESARSCVIILTNQSQASSEYGILYIDAFSFERPEHGSTISGCIPIMNFAESYISVLGISARAILTEIVVVNINDTDSGSPNPPTDDMGTESDINFRVIIPTASVSFITILSALVISFGAFKILTPKRKVVPSPQAQESNLN